MMSTKSYTTKTGYYNNSQKKTAYTDKKTSITSKSKNKSSNSTKTQFYQVSDPLDYSNIQNKFDSKILTQPILNTSLYQRAIESEFPSSSKEKMKLKLLQYNIVKESLDHCSSFPSNIRKYIYQFLFSLPNHKDIFEKYNKFGIHPFYRFLNDIYPLDDETLRKNLQKVCSLLAFYSPLIGNIYFLPELVFPFVKCFPNEEHFLFELIIGFFHSVGNFWFEFYPGPPLYHIKLSEKIIEHEEPLICENIEKIYRKSDIDQMKLTELIWRLIRNLFSESLIKEHWLQLIDFLFANNHKPEMILYIASSYILGLKNELLRAENPDDIKNALFDVSNYTKLTTIFKKAKELYKKYNKYQIYKYTPYIPIYSDYSLDYNKLPDNIFPDDYKENVNFIKDEMIQIDKEYNQKDIHLVKTEKHFKELLRKELEAQRKFLSELSKENEKENIIKKELDIALLHKMRYNEELAKSKINKITELNNTIKNTVNIFNNLNDAEVKSAKLEMDHRKQYENIVLGQRLLHEQINSYDKECNKGLEKLQKLRKLKENQQKQKNDENNELQNEMNEVKRAMEYIKYYNKDIEEHDQGIRDKENEFYRHEIMENGDLKDFNTINQNKNMKSSNVISSNNIFSTQFSDNNYMYPNVQFQNKTENRYAEET